MLVTEISCQDQNFRIITADLNMITDSRVRSIICKGPTYRFPSPIDINKCHEEIAGSLQKICNRWYKHDHVESDALNTWKSNIFKIIDNRISFYCKKYFFFHINLYSLRNLKKFHRKFVLAPADKAANNSVFV